MHTQLLHLKFPGFVIQQVTFDETLACIQARSLSQQSNCPVCHQTTERIHSWYQRHPHDLPWCGVQVDLHLTVPKFFCDNPTCLRKIFVERLPRLIPMYAQTTQRLHDTLRLLAFGLGGELGRRIISQLGLVGSADTLLRRLRQPRLTSGPTPRVLGIDDWAYRRGRQYGTILCDLETHQVVDLLPDRNAQTMAQWLISHPGVEIVSRDRGINYIEGVTLGAPQAQQVADRWHLLKNLRESVQTEIERRHRQLTWIVSPEADTVFDPPAPIMTKASGRISQTQKRTARLSRYEQVIALHAKGYTHKQIIATVGLSHRTIIRYKKHGVFPERAARRPNTQQILDAFLPTLEQRWHEGCKNAAQIYRDLITQGFQGSYGIVADHVRRLRHGQTARRELPPTALSPAPQYVSLCQASWLLVQTSDSLNEAQKQNLTEVLHHYPELTGLHACVSDFVEMVQKRTGRHLTGWLQRIEQSPYLALHAFAKGIRRDEVAVQAGLSIEWSNGQVEGQVNRLKMIKRQMYGRANFDLLRQRVLMRL